MTTPPQIVPPDKTAELTALIAKGLRAAGRTSYGNFIPKGNLAYAGAGLRVVTGVGILAMMALKYYQAGGLDSSDVAIGTAIASWLAGTGLTDAGNRRNEDEKA